MTFKILKIPTPSYQFNKTTEESDESKEQSEESSTEAKKSYSNEEVEV